MKLDELNTIDNKFRYCDKQQHLKLGSGKETVQPVRDPLDVRYLVREFSVHIRPDF